MRRVIGIGVVAALLIGIGAAGMWVAERENSVADITETRLELPRGAWQYGLVGSHCWPKGFFGYVCADGPLRYPSLRVAPPGKSAIAIFDSEPSELALHRLQSPDEGLELQPLEHETLRTHTWTKVTFDLPPCRDNFLQLSASWGSRGISDRSATWGFLVRTTGC